MYKNSETFGNGSVSTPVHRDGYDAIITVPDPIKDLVKKVREAAGWETGVTSEGMKRGGYEARNIDVYGYDISRSLAVIQIRRAWKKKASWFTEVSKAYALVGVDEGQIFSHPLTSSPRRNSHLRDLTPEAVVEWAESKIFGVPVSKLHTIIRQGDIALIPVRGIPKYLSPRPETGVQTLTLQSSHQVQVDGLIYGAGDQLYADGDLEVVHVKGEHKAISGSGKFRIVVGEKADSPWWMDAEMGD